MKDFHTFKKFSSESLEPTKKFKDQAKGRFLAAFDARFGTRPEAVQPSSRGMWVKAVIGVLSFAAVMVSVSAYADTANVAADNPLYPFKRFTENVQLALTPTDNQAQLEATLATRRANELEDLSVRKPASNLIAKLSVDFQNDVNDSLKDIADVGEHPGSATAGESNGGDNDNKGSDKGPNLTSPSLFSASITASGTASASAPAVVKPSLTGVASIVCGQVSSILSHSSAARTRILNDSDLLERFEARCGINVGSSASASGTSSASASTTILIVPKEHGDSNKGGQDPGINNEGGRDGNHDGDSGDDGGNEGHSVASSSVSSSQSIHTGIHIPPIELGL